MTVRRSELGLRLLSFALALALMVVVHGERRVSLTFTVPAEVQLPGQLRPAAPLPAIVRVSVAGPWARLRSLQAADVGPAAIDFTPTSPDVATWSVRPESLHLPNGVQVEAISPSQGTVQLAH
jgi:hypothetical protein